MKNLAIIGIVSMMAGFWQGHSDYSSSWMPSASAIVGAQINQDRSMLSQGVSDAGTVVTTVHNVVSPTPYQAPPPGMPDIRVVPFFNKVLILLGAPQTANNVNILGRWAVHEGTAARWNPLATTMHMPGSWGLRGNPNGNNPVQEYPDEATGEAATARTLINGHYPDVAAALRADAPISTWRSSGAIQRQIHVWGTGGFAVALSRGKD